MTATVPASSLRSRPISRSWRNLLLSAHIIASVGLLGTDAAVLTLTVAGWRHADPRTIYPAAHLIAAWLLLPLAGASVLTGLILGLLTRWGITRYWWVAIKLVLNLAGLVLALSVLLPELNAAAHAANALHAARPGATASFGLTRDTAAASTVLISTVLLAVYKPFGRLPGRRRVETERPHPTTNRTPT
jgi:uncharacterized membrane protein